MSAKDLLGITATCELSTSDIPRLTVEQIADILTAAKSSPQSSSNIVINSDAVSISPEDSHAIENKLRYATLHTLSISPIFLFIFDSYF